MHGKAEMPTVVALGGEDGGSRGKSRDREVRDVSGKKSSGFIAHKLHLLRHHTPENLTWKRGSGGMHRKKRKIEDSQNPENDKRGERTSYQHKRKKS